MQAHKHEVIIAGGGPTGMMLAGELALAGIDVAIVERRRTQDVEGSRASALHARSMEILDQRGIVDRFVSQGTKHYAVPFAGMILPASDRPTRHNYTLALRQEKIERTLADWMSEMTVKTYRGAEIVSFRQGEAAVETILASGGTLQSEYLVGCDGGRSLVRKTAGIELQGWEPTASSLIFEAVMAEEPPSGMHYAERGTCAIGRTDDGDLIRGVVVEQELRLDDKPTDDQLRAALIAAYGSDFGLQNVAWLSRFTDAARLAVAYRKGRVLLAGDAAHVHSPVGGQGLNIGLQDAVNLGWKLAQVVRGVSPCRLLDTYHAERHPAGADLLRKTLALSALSRGDPRTNFLREMLATPMQMDEPRKWYAAMISGLDIRYEVGGEHPLLGCRMPDLDIVIAGERTRVFTLLHDARPVLLNLGEPGRLAADGWSDRVNVVDARLSGMCELPGLGATRFPTSILLRPDGHVVWIGYGGSEGLVQALGRWFGVRK